MAITNLITAGEVVSKGVKKTSYDTTKITQNIPFSQERWIRPFLGDDFYDELIAASGSFNTEQTDLMDNYIKPALSYFVLYDTFWENQIKEMNAGNVLAQTDFTSQPSTRMLEIKRNDLKEKANIWLNHAQKFIEDTIDSDSSKFTNYSAGLSDYAQRSGSNVYIPD